MEVGVLYRPQMASPLYPSNQQLRAKDHGRSDLRSRNALDLGQFSLVNYIASNVAWRLFLLMKCEDPFQVAREALVHSALR